MALKDLRRSPMMSHLLDALERGEDIGYYGRLTFAMVAHNFLDRDELVGWLVKDAACDESAAKSLAQQVAARDYNPPSRQRILEWQAQQAFPICPTPDEPSACNPYRNWSCPRTFTSRSRNTGSSSSTRRRHRSGSVRSFRSLRVQVAAPP